jgi:hypothetical protein
MTIRAPKDFWTGVMYIAFAAVALWAARGYSLGSAGRMGPGYFPMLLGIVLAFLGIVLVVRSLVIAGESITRMHVLPLAVIALGVCLFGLLIEKLGLIVALVAATMVSALASREQRPIELVALALVLAVFSVGIFVYALRLPLPVWPALWG